VDRDAICIICTTTLGRLMSSNHLSFVILHLSLKIRSFFNDKCKMINDK
jgi:hypothetical protein